MAGSDPSANGQFNGFWKSLSEIAKYISRFGPVGPVAIACVSSAACVIILSSGRIGLIIFITFDLVVYISFAFFSIWGALQDKRTGKAKLAATAAKGEARKQLWKTQVNARAGNETSGS